MLTGVAAAGAVLLLLGCAAVAPPVEPARWVEPVTGITFVRLPAGRFVMGSPADEPGREPQEVPHVVRLSRATWMAVAEVTQGQWRAVIGTDPSHFRGDDTRPVERVNWHDARAFTATLSRRSPGNRFRLPTESEWEYACRAGATTPFAFGHALSTGQANIGPLEGDALGGRRQTTTVAAFAANAWGLHDMHGNVWEWVEDDHCPYPTGAVVDPVGRCQAPLKVIRGGSWAFPADSARCALRYTHRPQDVGYSLGFRLVREVASPPAPR